MKTLSALPRKLSFAVVWAVLSSVQFFFPTTAAAQTWTWAVETVDTSARFTSLAVDRQGNVHISYSDGDSRNLYYAFRSAESAKWFTMQVDGQINEFSTHLTLDADDKPHICYTPRILKYARWDGKEWKIQRVQTRGQIEFTCSIAISRDGTPHLSWYEKNGPDGIDHLHLKYAVLQDGMWKARTVDSEGEAGKWSSIVLEPSGDPVIAYSRFPSCVLKLAKWDGKKWEIQILDSYNYDRVEGNRGMGNALLRDAKNILHVSYYHDNALRYAEQKGERWSIQSVDPVSPFGGWVGYWSGMVLDHQGWPHICYEDAGALKHAYWDGNKWHVQLIVAGGSDQYRYSSIGISSDDKIYIAFRDPTDGSLQVAVGTSRVPTQAAGASPAPR